MNISDIFTTEFSSKNSTSNLINNNPRRTLRTHAVTKEELADLGRTLSSEHKIKTGLSNDRRLFLRLRSNCQDIEDSYLSLTETARKKEAITPGAEWLLDNYHVIEKQINDIRNHFPRGYDKTLPRLLEGPYKLYPRVFHLSLEFITQTDYILDVPLLNAFLEGYQTNSVLHIGEVWALPIMIRFSLLENLRNLSLSMLQAREELKAAEDLIEDILGDETKPGTQILLNLAEKVMLRPDFLTLGAGHLIRRLRDRGRKAALTLQWLEERLREEGKDPEEILKTEQRLQAADQISIGNIFTSLRNIGYVDWEVWFEQNCKVEHILRLDPVGIYPQCDFKTRDAYRHRVEKLAKYSGKSETEIASTAVSLSRNYLSLNQNIPDEELKTHMKASVGGYFSQEGLLLLESALGYSPDFILTLTRSIKKNPLPFYLFSILFFTLVPFLYAIAYGQSVSLFSWEIPLIALLTFLPSTDLGNNITQLLVTKITTPNLLPKLNFENGIPEKYKTVVVVHSLFTDRTSAKNTIESTHVRYLGNNDNQLTFCILADLSDAKTEVTDKDEVVISYSKEKIAALNERYGKNKFIILFRKRIWNPNEEVFMAWERKRGKIEEFNRLLLGANDTSFIITPEETQALSGIKLVITLDNDSQLPRGAAQKLVAAAVHPLNKPVVDPDTSRVISGYSIIQPRVGVSLTSANISSFAKIFCGHAGLDPYTQSISDVYQDLFNEGSYIGKGIYHVDAFEKALHNRVPENTLLSHDLFEGIFARVALASDIELYDDFPSKYHVHAKRQHRWIRGDWQLLPWLGIETPARVSNAPSRVSSLGWWKIFDNLRRSLIAPSLFLLLVFGTVVLPGNPLFWILFAALIIAFPVYTNLAQALIIPPRGMSIESHIGGIAKDFAKMSKQTLLTLTVMPHQAFISTHAIVITLFRLFISKKHLLQWETAYHSERRMTHSTGSFINEMKWSLLTTFGSFAWLTISAPQRLPLVIPIYLLWFSAPFVAKEVSRPKRDSVSSLGVDKQKYVYHYAFNTWRYFARFLNEENNYLIPDNFQEVPIPVLAQRTSPTNISLSMLTTISAYDLGFISAPHAVSIVNKIFKGLSKLERYNGHFLNWYKTDTAESLYPRYVSAVDSGNMVGHLVALRSALFDHKRMPLITKKHVSSILSELALLTAVISQESKDSLAIANKTISNTSSICVADAYRLYNSLYDLNSHLKIEKDSSIEIFKTAIDDIVSILNNLKWLQDIASLPAFANIDTILPITPENLFRVIYSVKEIISSSEPSSDLNNLNKIIEACELMVKDFCDNAENVMREASAVIHSIDFTFLYDASKDLFAIGYNVDAARRDNSYYDLLASESRLGSLCAIALGQIPERHWFSLGRGLTQTIGGKALLSWTGTMFEYLMPLLVMRSYGGTLLHETYDVVVRTQRAYGRQKKVPWGISESSFSGVDFEKTYQYRAFGVPGLGLKRGLEDDLVISPYSAMLALQVDPENSVANLQIMEKLGFTGQYGFYEAIDYTLQRLSPSENFHIVKSYFAHHQGMSMVSMNNSLNDGIWQNRFHKDPLIQSVDLVLQERFPDRLPVILPQQPTTQTNEDKAAEAEMTQQIFNSPHTSIPRTHILSNGRYTVMVDNAGSGFSTYDKEFALTRWKEDLVSNDMGTFIFFRDLVSKDVWSSGFQPTLKESEMFEAIFSPDKAEYKRKDFGIYTHQEITVSPEEDVEIRRITIANTTKEKRIIEVTSYAEVALAPIKADQAHPAFAKMFIQSDFIEEFDALLFSRRPRSKSEERAYMLHQVIMNTVWDRTHFESSREEFLGRGNSVHSAQALYSNKFSQLTGTIGYVLDPCMSLRVRVEVNPGESQTITFITGFSKQKDELLQVARRYRDTNQVSRAFEIAWSQASIELRNEQAFGKNAPVFQKLANGLIFNIEKLRAKPDVISRNRLGQSGLWRFGISGDLPICLVRVVETNQTKIVEELLQAHHYLRNRGFQFDLVIFNEHSGGYLQTAQDEIEFLIRSSFSAPLMDRKGGIFVRNLTQLSEEERDLIQSVSRVVLSGLRGTLMQQLKLDEPLIPWVPFERKRSASYSISSKISTSSASNLEFFNGVGGFDEDGRSYAFKISNDSLPPAPWSNVIANPKFGTLVTEVGGGYTWSENSRENRITGWSNDPVSDPLQEVLYIRDTRTGSYWCPTPKPVPLESEVTVHHRFGETEFSTLVEGISSTLSISVSPNDNVKFWNLHLTNTTPTIRNLEVYLYVNWVLGVQKQDTYTQIVSDFDKESSLLYATNRYNVDFGRKVIFMGSSIEIEGYTSNRSEFIGRNRDVSSPIILAQNISTHRGISKPQVKLSHKIGSGFDSCGVIKVNVPLEGNSSNSVAFFLGDADSIELMKSKVSSLHEYNHIQSEIKQTKDNFKISTSAVLVKTPDRSFDILMNGWLLYQTLSCRLWGRTGFYQSGGAFGFRDQLQDSMALLYSRPDYVKNQIMLHAGRQFPEGDVQHWWHPPLGKGVRTKISDDYLWLPLITQKYIEVTGDEGILEERAGFIDGPLLAQNEHEAYIVPTHNSSTASIYEKCLLMLDRSLQVGVHGLPLMGCGDWNDGMNEIGKNGKGESVWMGWFLATVLKHFIPIVEKRGDFTRSAKYLGHIEALSKALEENAWDGQWYTRAYFDDGSPVGSSVNEECKIDSLPQSWSIISGIGDDARSRLAMNNVYENLVSKEHRIIKLFTPPFNTGPQEPGYIKGYLPGVRENGGQYTHAAAWVIIATALLKDGSKAISLFDLINPVDMTKDAVSVKKYRGEPYVLCGDVYSAAPHEGRAGWSWYTGSASWMYQAGIEYIIGLKIKGDHFILSPAIPSSWKEAKIKLTRESATFDITIKNESGLAGKVNKVIVNNSEIIDQKVFFDKYKGETKVEVII